MKRRLFAMLAVPALALGFGFASPGTDEAQADSIHDYACWQMKQYVSEAYSYGDVDTAQDLEGWVARYC